MCCACFGRCDCDVGPAKKKSQRLVVMMMNMIMMFNICIIIIIKLHLIISKLLSRPCPTGGGVGSKGNVACKLKGRGQHRCITMVACEVQELHDDGMQQIDGGWCTLGDYYLLLCPIVLRLPQQLAACCCRWHQAATFGSSSRPPPIG